MLIKNRWQKRMKHLGTEEWSKQFATEIAGEVSAKVGEFCRQLRQDAEFLHRQDAEGADYADPTDWRKVVLNQKDISKSITGDPATLRFVVDGAQLAPFYEAYGRHSVYLHVVLK